MSQPDERGIVPADQPSTPPTVVYPVPGSGLAPYPSSYPVQQHPGAAPGQPQVPPHYANVAATLGRKEPALAGILSWLLPGLGQFYNGNVVAGVLFLVVYLINLPFLILLFFLVVPVVVALTIGLVSIIHAIIGSQQHNRLLAAHLMRGG